MFKEPHQIRNIFIPLLVFLFFSFLNPPAQSQESQEPTQQIDEFSLAGYEEKGKKSWDISGKSADILENTVKLKDVESNLYGDSEDIKLTAEKGDFDKKEGKIHLEQDVVITTSTGARLTTDSLDWDKKNRLVTTEDVVNITRDNMVTVASGAKGEPNLNKVTLEKDVKVDIHSSKEVPKDIATKNEITITCDGPLEIDYGRNIAIFKNNVLVDTEGMQINSDLMNIYFLSTDKSAAQPNEPGAIMGTRIDKIIAQGNVKIVRGENVSYSDEATYTATNKKITLSGKPRLVIYSTEDLNASFRN